MWMTTWFERGLCYAVRHASIREQQARERLHLQMRVAHDGGLSFQQIAEETNVSYETARRIVRALEDEEP
jgi:transposase